MVMEFRCGRRSTIDAERSGRRPAEAAIPETTEKIRNMVLADRRLKVWQIVESITWGSGIDFERALGYAKAIRKMDAAFAHNRP